MKLSLQHNCPVYLKKVKQVDAGTSWYNALCNAESVSRDFCRKCQIVLVS